MSDKFLPTDPYKGVRDFYPEDMAVQQYIFDTWAYTAESFGFERYDASVLEPSALYKAKGAENEEMVNEQTYTFIDRGDREVTLRPEMTPTVARMIAAKRKELAFPVRWYSIPNLFRYERAQRGRLREHWQLNCDIFGSNDISVDVEIIALAYQIFMNFGADESMFEILVNNRQTMKQAYNALEIGRNDQITEITRLNDRKDKINSDEYMSQLIQIVEGDVRLAEEIKTMIEQDDAGDSAVVAALSELGITNVRLDRSLARGFDYYTGTIFEFKDKAEGNNRSLLGGGRYDNLTGLFGGEAVPGIGFGFGDVTMRDFLETHELLSTDITSPTVMVLPTDAEFNMHGQKVAQAIRQVGVSVATDVSTRKVGKKLAAAGESLVTYALIIGENEAKTEKYSLKNLTDGEEFFGSIEEIVAKLNT